MKQLSLVSAFFLLLIQVSLGFEQQSFVSCPLPSSSPPSLLHSLKSDFDVRLILDREVILVASPTSFSSLLSVSPSCFLLSPYLPSSHSYFLAERPDFDLFLPSLESSWSFKTLEISQKLGLSVIFSSPRRFLFSSLGRLPSSSSLSLFPEETEIIPLPLERILPSSSSSSFPSLSFLSSKKTDIQDLVDQVSASSLTDFDLYLTGERNDSSVFTRNSYSKETWEVAGWLKENFENDGQSVELHEFREDMGPNVIGLFLGEEEPEKFIVIGAHFDSRATSSSSTTQRAPGANDDGSGTSVLLEISRLIAKNKLRFRYSVILGAWCGEEQGLIGSRAYARKCKDEGKEIIGMIQGDMLAYRREGERPQCAFPTRYHTPELTTFLKEVVTTFVPEVMVCDTSACCSDHQSFYEQGYPATQFFERCGGIADNQYHREGDVVERAGFDIPQWEMNAKAMFASLLAMAEVL